MFLAFTRLYFCEVYFDELHFVILRLIGQNEERLRTESEFSININDTIICHLLFWIQFAGSTLLLDFGDYVITVLAWPELGKILSHCQRVLDQIVHASIQFSFKNKNADTVMKVKIFKIWAKQFVCYTDGLKKFSY